MAPLNSKKKKKKKKKKIILKANTNKFCEGQKNQLTITKKEKKKKNKENKIKLESSENGIIGGGGRDRDRAAQIFVLIGR
jgi:hypothetical protein